MRVLKEEITEEFMERLVDASMVKLIGALRDIDISVDYIAALISDRSGIEIGARQKTMGRMAPVAQPGRPKREAGE